MIGTGDARYVFFAKFSVYTVNHAAEFSDINEQRFVRALSETWVYFVSRDKPETNGDLCGIEKLTGQRHHAIDQVGIDDIRPNLAFTGSVGTH